MKCHRPGGNISGSEFLAQSVAPIMMSLRATHDLVNFALVRIGMIKGFDGSFPEGELTRGRFGHAVYLKEPLCRGTRPERNSSMQGQGRAPQPHRTLTPLGF